MKLNEFIKQFCQDILDVYNQAKQNGKIQSMFDYIDTDADGKDCYFITAGKYPINVDDIFDLVEDEFEMLYPHPECMAARTQYLSNFDIRTGMNAFMGELIKMQENVQDIKNKFALYQETLKDDKSIPDKKGTDMARRLYAGGF